MGLPSHLCKEVWPVAGGKVELTHLSYGARASSDVQVADLPSLFCPPHRARSDASVASAMLACSERNSMSGHRPYQVYVYVGDKPQPVEGARVIDLTPEELSEASVLEALSRSALNSADLRSRVVFVVDADASGEMAAKSVLAYSAMLGLARRRLDVAFGWESQPVVMADLDSLARKLPDSGKPGDPTALLHIVPALPEDTCCEAEHLVLGSRLNMADVTAVRHARRVNFDVPELVADALPQFIAVASMRARGETERLPLLGGTEVDLESVRRASEGLRRTMRGDNRSAVVEPAPSAQAFERLQLAAQVDMLKVLEALGARSRTVEVAVKDEAGEPTGEMTTSTVWHCLHPENHSNGDASPSARVTYSESGAHFRCFRCLAEKVDALRLTMWSRSLTPDEAADWILSNTK